MEYNIDILVAGCNTTCLHCYVNGGKAPSMPLEDFKICMQKFLPVFERLKHQISYTLDNEVYNHENAVEILEYVEKNAKENYFHHGSTTGIAFLHHPKQKEILEVLKRNDWNSASFAIHGKASTHNQIVHSENALDAIIKASKIFKDNDCKVLVSLMLSKKMRDELEEVDQILKAIEYDTILPVIPDYYPISRLNKYQEIRCNKDEYTEILEFLRNKNVNIDDIQTCIYEYNEENVIDSLHLDTIKTKLTSENTVFFHVDHNLNFYCGNTGSTQKLLGNIKTLDCDAIYNLIVNSKDNYYETYSIHYEDILDAIKTNNLMKSKENYVYPNEIAALLAMIHNNHVKKKTT